MLRSMTSSQKINLRPKTQTQGGLPRVKGHLQEVVLNAKANVRSVLNAREREAKNDADFKPKVQDTWYCNFPYGNVNGRVCGGFGPAAACVCNTDRFIRSSSHQLHRVAMRDLRA